MNTLCRFIPSTGRQVPKPTAAIFFRCSHKTRQAQCMSTSSDEPELKEFIDYFDNLKNYEKCGVPKGAGTDSEDGFDLGRMRKLMQLLGNPHCKFKAVHIAGTKGKGSTAAFLSSILRAEGYSVGCYTSPHICTIRERITLGTSSEPVSAKILSTHFQSIRTIIDHAIELENQSLSHFEVFTAVALSLFARESVDIAVIEAGLGGARDATNIISSSMLAASVITTIGEEHLAALGGSLESIAMAKSGIIKDGRPLVLGGPFLPHIERILQEKASILSCPIVSASDSANKSILKSIEKIHGTPRQSCDIVLQIEKDLQLFIELLDVKLLMLGSHQLKNAVTATCAALCLRGQGWRLSNNSIRAGLEGAFLLGRNQILTLKEAEVLGLSGTTVLVDGAHTKESARALASTIEMVFSERELVLVVAMANDKDHLGFARELLTVKGLNAVLFTEVGIAGDNYRTTSVSSLRSSWIQASRELDLHTLKYTIDEHEDVTDQRIHSEQRLDCQGVLFAEGSLSACLKAGCQILAGRAKSKSRIIVVTGSLYVVSAILGSLKGKTW